MRLLAGGVNHRSAPVEVRERLALRPPQQIAALRDVIRLPQVAEALTLSTCNRLELYVVESPCSGTLLLDQLVTQITGVPLEELSRYLYVYEDRAAAQHLCEVASGADSMVIGECEIMGQVKEAAELARTAGTLGTVLTRLAELALQAGKRARTETGIDEGCASVASVALSLARQICGDLKRTVVLLVGAGETAELVLQRLLEGGTKQVLIANRTLERATELAKMYGGTAIALHDIYEIMTEADVVISSTGAPHPVIHAEPMRTVVRARGGRPLFMIDLAVPRDVEPATGNWENVFLYNIDSLQQIVHEALREREGQLPRVREICADQAEKFWAWAASLELVPTMLELRARAEALRQQELEHALKQMGHLTVKQQKHLHLLTKRLVQAIIEEPLTRLRAKACEGDGLTYLNVIRELFGLDRSPAPFPPPSPESNDEGDQP
ncbi:MAG: glutamyl-tRNA reductase [Candidatus Zipacnadales bacterium]